MTAGEARVAWGEGRGVGRGLWRELFGFGGRVSRRQFVVVLLVWLVAGSGLVMLLAGDVSWARVGGAAWSLPEGSGWEAALVQFVMWAGVAGVVVRRWRDTGWFWLPAVLLGWYLAWWPVVAVPVALLVLGLVPAAGWFDRWRWLSEQGRLENSPRGSEQVEKKEPAGVLRPEPVVEGPPLESMEDMREWLYGGEDEPAD